MRFHFPLKVGIRVTEFRLQIDGCWSWKQCSCRNGRARMQLKKSSNLSRKVFHFSQMYFNHNAQPKTAYTQHRVIENMNKEINTQTRARRTSTVCLVSARHNKQTFCIVQYVRTTLNHKKVVMKWYFAQTHSRRKKTRLLCSIMFFFALARN